MKLILARFLLGNSMGIDEGREEGRKEGRKEGREGGREGINTYKRTQAFSLLKRHFLFTLR